MALASKASSEAPAPAAGDPAAADFRAVRQAHDAWRAAELAGDPAAIELRWRAFVAECCRDMPRAGRPSSSSPDGLDPHGAGLWTCPRCREDVPIDAAGRCVQCNAPLRAQLADVAVNLRPRPGA